MVAAASPDLELAPSEPVKTRAAKVMYRRTRAEVIDLLVAAGMERSEHSDRKLKEWVSKGRAANDLPPFDDLPKMVEWWQRMRASGQLKKRVPDYLMALSRGSEPTPPPPAATAEHLLPSLPVMDDQIRETAGNDEIDDAALTQLYAFARGHQADMEEARALKDDSRFWRAYDRYAKTSEQIRKWQTTALAVKKSRGDVVDVRTEMDSLAQVFGVIALSFSNVLFAQARLLAPEKSEAELREIIYPARDKCFAHLKATKFASAYAPCLPPS